MEKRKVSRDERAKAEGLSGGGRCAVVAWRSLVHDQERCCRPLRLTDERRQRPAISNRVEAKLETGRALHAGREVIAEEVV